MLLRMLELGEHVADIVFFDTGWEFPEMYDHLAEVEKFMGRTITRLVPRRSLNYWMLEHQVKYKNGEPRRIGNGWPSPFRRWCTSMKIRSINHYYKGLMQRSDIGHHMTSCVGFAADEMHRAKEGNEAQKNADKGGWSLRFPMIEWGMTEADALAYCKDRGFTWGGLYDHFHRVSCFCCPLQSLDNLSTLRKVRPELWQRMLAWEDKMDKTQLRRFHHEKSVHDLEQRFALEDIKAVLG